MSAYKHCGLTGQKVRIRPKVLQPTSETFNGANPDPWRWQEQTAQVIQERPDFLTLTMLPHQSLYGESHPYNITVMKHDLVRGETIIKDLDGNRIR